MARPRGIEDDQLMGRLAAVFAETGYDGASLARLAQAAGLQKASLYHRFPGGKAQMADEVLQTVEHWIAIHVTDALAATGPAEARLQAVADHFAALYEGGRRPCLLNMLARLPGGGGPVEDRVARALAALRDAFAGFAESLGLPQSEAASRGLRAVMLVQGGLVLSRGLGDTAAFVAALNRLPVELGLRPEGGQR
ncbi:TetR/AcrR family transcriptional regulator [Neotabrizicola sp. sgz301269]|uniref:TetR/AcrR family transcriptional regulator n=1 Tax=Neotabrizicola sp. sgz301269 TaxID=3276282 RepID=UPI00376F6B77